MREQGEIVLIPVPFTDLSSQKQRPVIIISNDTYNRTREDVVDVAMTSNPTVAPFSFKIETSDLVDGKLNRPGTVRVDKVYTLAKAIIVKRFGMVSPQIVDRIRKLLAELTEQRP